MRAISHITSSWNLVRLCVPSLVFLFPSSVSSCLLLSLSSIVRAVSPLLGIFCTLFFCGSVASVVCHSLSFLWRSAWVILCLPSWCALGYLVPCVSSLSSPSSLRLVRFVRLVRPLIVFVVSAPFHGCTGGTHKVKCVLGKEELDVGRLRQRCV